LTALTDTTPPVVTAFTAGAITGTGPYTIPISTFTATGNDAIAGYAITTTPVPPNPANSALWTYAAPASYSVTTPGVYDLYGWAKDLHNNVSAAVIATVQVATVIKKVSPTDPNASYTKISDAIAWANSYGAGAVVQIDASANPWSSWAVEANAPCSPNATPPITTNFSDNIIGSVTASGITIQGYNGVAHLNWLCHDPITGNGGYGVTGSTNHGSMVSMSAGNTSLRLENLEISGAGYTGVGVWVENTSGTLYIKNSIIDNNEGGGLLTGIAYNLNLVIIGSQFYDNAHFYGSAGEYHNIYVGEINSFMMFNSTSREAYEGILVKSRASHNYIFYNRLTDEAGDLCATQNYCSDKNIDLPYGKESYIVGNLFQKSIKDDQDGTFINFDAEQRFTLYFSAGNGTMPPQDGTNYVTATNSRTGHSWRIRNYYGGAAYGFTGTNQSAWTTGTATGAIYDFVDTNGNTPSCSDTVPLNNCAGTVPEFQNGDVLNFSGYATGRLTVTAPASETVGHHNQWSFGTSTALNGFYAVDNTFVNNYFYAYGSSYATFSHNDTAFAYTYNNVYVDIQTGSGANVFPMTLYPSNSSIPTVSTNDYWIKSDPGFTSIGTFDYSLTSTGASNIGVSSVLSPVNGLQIQPTMQYVDPASGSNRFVPGCKGEYGGFSNACTPKPMAPTDLRIGS